MKIGIDAKCFVGNFTGVGNYCYNLLNELMLLRSDDEFYLFANKDFTIDLANVNKIVSKGLICKSGVLWLMSEAPRLFQKHNIDVFWATSGLIPLNLMGVKTVLTIYDFVWRRYPSTMPFLYRNALSRFTKSSIENADKIVTISDSTAAEVLSYYGRVPDKVIRPGVSAIYQRRDPNEVQKVKVKYNIGSSYNLIVGTLEPRKNLDTFLRAYCDLAETTAAIHIPELVIVGNKGWRNSRLLSKIQSLENRGLVKRLGYVPEEDLPALYTGANLFFMPSLYEGFGMPVLEAYSCATPVVISDIPALHEACCNCGLFYDPSYIGIRDILCKIYCEHITPIQPDASLVDWNWSSGAEKLSQVIDSAIAGR